MLYWVPLVWLCRHFQFDYSSGWGLIGASLSEPHTSVLNGGFSYIIIIIYLPYVCRSINASWHSFNPKHCARRSMQAKYRKQLRKDSTLEPFTSVDGVKLNQRRSKKTSDRAQRDRARCAAETADQRSERLRNWEWGTVQNALLKLLVKDKPLYSGKVREGRKGNKTSEERETRLQRMRQTGSEKILGERLKITADMDQPARKAG